MPRLAAIAALCAALVRLHAGLPPPPGDVRGPLLPGGEKVRSFEAVFSESGPSRATLDIPLECDLRMSSGISFDFFCDSLRPFSSFICYLRSGNGWRSATFSPDEEGAWQHIVVRKTDMSPEGKPSGWGDVSAMRISGWRASAGKSVCAIANISVLEGPSDVAVVYSDTRDGSSFAARIVASLESLGLRCSVLSEGEITPEALEGVHAAVLPYNPAFPAGKLPVLRDFVASGRRALACYVLPAGVGDVLGIGRQLGVQRPKEGISGFLKVGRGLPGQPGFAPQTSWITQRVEPPRGAETLAVWAATDGRKSTGVPAMVRTSGGLYMAHVWLGGADGESRALVRSIASALSPVLAAKVAGPLPDDRAAVIEEARKVVGAVPAPQGETRAFWCHEAYGMGGGRDWNGTARFLAENGFNRVYANLAWGGSVYYGSRVLPAAGDVKTRGDAFQACRAACRRHGISFHVWKVCWNMGASAPAAFASRMAAEGRTQVSFNGKQLPKWLCPSHPANRAMEVESLVELAEKGADGVQLDYIRYPDADSCFCDGCRKRFEEEAGTRVRNWPADVRTDHVLAKAWTNFRSGCIGRTVREASERIRKRFPKVEISAAVFPKTDSPAIGQCWVEWVRAGWLDFVCPMDYAESTALFRSQALAQLEAVGAGKVFPGIGLSGWRNAGPESDALRLARQIRAVRELGFGGFTVFNLDQRAGVAVSELPMD